MCDHPASASAAALLASRWTAAMRAQDYDLAWALARRQLDARDPADRDNPALPYHLRWVWDGRDPTGRRCLVRCYHGLGDTLQFARFLPLLARRAASVRVEGQARLLPLLGRVAAAAGVTIQLSPFDIDRPLPPSDCDLEITELPLALRATPADAPAPYLPPRRAILPPGTVGLCHSAGDWDAARSIPAPLLQPLCAQVRCLGLVAAATRLPVLNPAGCPFDMEATAALVASCDLVITVDTMVAHLAGAMGRPTWLLLKAEPDWRWPVEGHHTPWYPTMHLYHQPRAGDWAGVLARVTDNLAAFVSTLARNGAP